MSYLRNRPFMVITYSYVLAAGQKSNAPGFGGNAEWEPIENMVICDRVSAKQLSSAELVIDILENNVVKTRDSSIDSNQLIHVFVKRHYEEIKSALGIWIQKDPINNLSKVQDFIERFKTKEDSDVESNPD